MVEFIESNNLKVVMLLNTHGHIDHVLGNSFVKDKFKVGLYIHKIEEPVMRAVKAYAGNYGFPMYQEASIDGYLEEGKSITFGTQQFKILFVPGHSTRSRRILSRKRKDPDRRRRAVPEQYRKNRSSGGQFDTLINSIHEKLFTLPDDVVVYAGHGPTTTIGFEKATNPFCALTSN
jgi:glyoxylase-like metal-dependent hydrolase (beta-lactamase superfamily II)